MRGRWGFLFETAVILAADHQRLPGEPRTPESCDARHAATWKAAPFETLQKTPAGLRQKMADWLTSAGGPMRPPLARKAIAPSSLGNCPRGLAECVAGKFFSMYCHNNTSISTENQNRAQ
jgi:hypothetical protein